MIAANSKPAVHAGEEQSSAQASQAAPAGSRYFHQGRAAAPMPAAPVQCWSTSNQAFDAESLSSLIMTNDWLRAGDAVYVADKKAISLNSLCDADDVILIINQRAQKLAGDAADGYPGVSKREKEILSAALAGWMALCCEPTFFGFENIRKHTLTDLDLDAAARAVIGAQP